MKYREMGSTGDQISILGYGCMRFPRDDKSAERQVISAIERGVNYFDTAYLYFGNEAVLGNILSKGYRDKVMIATKLPPVQIGSMKDMEKILNLQLERLKTDHIDYYLMHNIMTFEAWDRLKQLGIEEFLMKSRDAGKIRRIGFSSHGGKEQFKRIVDDYPWDMCQIQYNYYDEFNQAGRGGLEYASSKRLGVVVMEPLRGGNLVNKLPKEAVEAFNRAEPTRSPAEWALRWIWNHPGVTSILSGMNEEAHIEENVRIASVANPDSLTDKELELIQTVKETIKKSMKVPCTGCEYCLPCPAGVNIPLCFSSYNDKFIYRDRRKENSYLVRVSGFDGGGLSYASLCKDCGACEKKCPQGLPIRAHLKEVSRDMEKFYFKAAAKMIQGYYKMRNKRKLSDSYEAK
jgi:predicted aldo/keto reductase-like oxidoreductase